MGWSMQRFLSRVSGRPWLFASSLFCILLGSGVVSGWAVPGSALQYLSIETWTIDDSIVHQGGSPEERLLQYARSDLSGMIYGYTYRYVPSDTGRQVSEVFELMPVAMIPWGSPNLTTLDVAVNESTWYGLFEYRLTEMEQLRASRWNSVRIPDAGGVGSAKLMDGMAGRQEAIRRAIRQAIRTHLQSLTRNKPRESTGRVVLVNPPRLMTDAGSYVAHVHVKVEVENVLDYEAF